MESPLVTSTLYGLTENKIMYSFTINVSTKKYINKEQWKDIDSLKQRVILKHFMDLAVKEYETTHKFVFEKTKQGMQHMHGTVFNACELQMILIQQYIHEHLGLAKINPNVVFQYKPVNYYEGWESYCHKDQSPKSPANSPKSPGESIDFVD